MFWSTQVSCRRCAGRARLGTPARLRTAGPLADDKSRGAPAPGVVPGPADGIREECGTCRGVGDQYRTGRRGWGPRSPPATFPRTCDERVEAIGRAVRFGAWGDSATPSCWAGSWPGGATRRRRRRSGRWWSGTGRWSWASADASLGDRHEAEDAFQATFLVLARKAGVIADAERLANWLPRRRQPDGARRPGLAATASTSRNPNRDAGRGRGRAGRSGRNGPNCVRSSMRNWRGCPMPIAVR